MRQIPFRHEGCRDQPPLAVQASLRFAAHQHNGRYYLPDANDPSRPSQVRVLSATLATRTLEEGLYHVYLYDEQLHRLIYTHLPGTQGVYLR